MKQILIILTIGLVLAGMIILTIQKALAVQQQLPPTKKNIELLELPDFKLSDAYATPFTLLDLETGRSVLVIHYSSSCDFCDKEAQILFHHYNEFENTQVLMVTKDSKEEIENFAEKHQLNHFPNIRFLRYSNNYFKEAFGTNKIPSLFFFDTNFKLLKKIEEGITTRTLVKYTRAANDR